MNCPRDAATLELKTFGHASVEVCPRCAGLVLEHGQLNQIAEPTSGDLEFASVDLDSFRHDDEYGPIACLADGTAMSKVAFVESSIILDYCKTCRGFWVDGKELVRINEEVKRLNEAEAEVPDPLLVRISKFVWNVMPH
jgi:Zn-finger nucleic acid-binding protein